MLQSAYGLGPALYLFLTAPACFSSRAAMNSMSSQPCRPISTQSITSTDSADSEENYVAMVSPGRTEVKRHIALFVLVASAV